MEVRSDEVFLTVDFEGAEERLWVVLGVQWDSLR